MFKRYVYIEGLTSLLGSMNKILINNNGEIKDLLGNDLDYNKDDQGHKTVHCSGWNGEQEYRVIDLVALQFKGLNIPLKDYGKVRAFVIDGNPENTHARNVGYRFEGGLLEYEERKGFYYVPGMPNIAINRNGEIVNSNNNTLLTLSVSIPVPSKNIKGGYRYVTGIFQRGRSVRYPRHRAMCLTFKEFPDNSDSLIVNHLNGIPGEDHPDNLEWATRGENNIHAYENGLKNQNMPVLVRNVLTGEVNEYYSISECSRVLGYSTDETIRQRIITSEFGQVFQDGTQVKLKSDTRDWVIPDDPKKAIEENQENVAVIVRNCITKEISFYESIRDASKATGVNESSIGYRFSVDNRSPLFGFQFKKKSDEREFPDYAIEELNNSLIENSFKLDARNLLTGEIKEYSSTREATKDFGSTVKFFIPNGKQPLFESGWQLKLKKDPWFDSRDLDEQLYKSTKEVMCRNELTGNIIISRDTASLAKTLGLDRKSIRKAAFTRGNTVYNGYRFRLGVTSDPWPETQIMFNTRS